ncbi:hypothetical protein Tco_0228600 [Tanacetum coccineum]
MSDVMSFWVSDDELKAPEKALQSPRQAPPSPDYVPSPEHPPLPDYVNSPGEPKQVPLSPKYVPKPEYPEYLVPSDAEAPIEDQPLPDDASPAALSLGYVAESNPEEETEEDPAEYPDNGGDDDDEEEEEHLALIESTALHTVDPVSSVEDKEAFEIDESAPTPPRSPRLHREERYPDNGGDDDDEDDDDKEEEEEHLAPIDSTALHTVDLVSSVEDTKAFKIDESAPTPPRSPRLHRAGISV